MLPIIGVKQQQLPSFKELHRIALNHIFAPGEVTAIEHKVLEEGVVAWAKKDLNVFAKFELRCIVNALIANEKGFWNRAKELQREHKVDFRKTYADGFPFIDVENRLSYSKS